MPVSKIVRGRGAKSNATGRFESLTSEGFDDGWTEEDAQPAQLHTVLLAEKPKTIITRNDSPDIGFDRSINPYRGCEHGCIYCFARPSHAYVGLSPGLDFETQLFFKDNAAKLLERELSKPSYRCERIQLGANTDPYQPSERKMGVTREILQVLQRFRHPVTITTKNALVTRDIDILSEMAADNLASVAVSVTTLDRKLARSMEPRASTPEKRLEAIAALSAAGVPAMAMFAPVIPGLNDHELEAVLERAAQAGAVRCGYVLLRLPWEIKDLFREWLAEEQPGRAAKVMSLIRQARGGKEYDATWGKRGVGEGPVAAMISSRFKVAIKRYGLDRPFPGTDNTKFRVPAEMKPQMELF
ncbi:MAG: PA0069 family radical SAM protein [Caulobacteraceae bacterium]